MNLNRNNRRYDLRGLLRQELLGAFLLLTSLSIGVTPVDAQTSLRVATFNVSLSSGTDGQMLSRLSFAGDAQASVIAEIIQRVDADIILLNEFDYEPGNTALDVFRDNYLSVAQNNTTAGPSNPIDYPFGFVAPSNTGVPSGLDLDNNGDSTGAGDAQGFGFHPGHFGMAVLSKFPVLTDQARTFRNFLWRDMPGALLPEDPNDADGNGDLANWYTADELDVVRLSSKSHWDVPINVNGQTLHVLAAHPTPPVFDGAEDRNGLRNHDEIRFWSDYVTEGQGDYIYDDSETSTTPSGGLDSNESFVIVGDYNADPFDGDSSNNAAAQLLNIARVNSGQTPSSLGGTEDAVGEGQANASHLGNPAFDTGDFNPFGPGNLRVDYVLPSTDLLLERTGVFWPSYVNDPLAALVASSATAFPFPGSDHRLVYADVVIGIPEPSTGFALWVGFTSIAFRRFRLRQSH